MLKDLLDKNDSLTEDTKNIIKEAFDKSVNERVEQLVKLEVETALKKLDEEYTTDLVKLLESIDQDHTNKIKQVIVKIDSDYATKAQEIIETYENMLESEAITFRNQLVSEMSNFIDLYLEQMIPKEQLEEAVNNTQANDLLSKIKKIVSIDEQYITDTIKDALTDGKDKIDSLSSELTESVKLNIKLNQDLKKLKTDLLISEKTAGFNEIKKSYVKRVLGNKSPEEVESNFDYVVEMFERDDEDHREYLKESAIKEVKTTNVSTPKADSLTFVEESVDVLENNDRASTLYLKTLKEQDGIK